jgi:hypothetical protein
MPSPYTPGDMFPRAQMPFIDVADNSGPAAVRRQRQGNLGGEQEIAAIDIGRV